MNETKPYLAVLNITTYQGQCADADHYYGKLILSQVLIDPDDIEQWNMNHLGQALTLEKEITLREAQYLDEKDGGHTYTYGWLHADRKTSERFDSIEEVQAAAKLKYEELQLSCPYIELYEGKKM